MIVIADTSVWIQGQRQRTSDAGRELDALLASRSVLMVGPVLAEILQGARSDSAFDFFVSHLDAMDYIETDRDTWVAVGKVGRVLKDRGALIGLADLVIGCMAIQHDVPLYALDPDFDRIPGLKRYVPVHQG